ncbi:MAG: hypothetical protein R2820_04900 [Cyclobacteriaceae bacterium]|nr:hypothetical protein [Cyclobacteriaceae bacterium]
MKVLATLLLLSTILISCQENDPEAESSEYIIVRNIDEVGLKKGIVSLYNSATKTYSEDVITLNPSQAGFTYASYKGGNLYLTTFTPPTLVKVDMESKSQIQTTSLWLFGKTIPFDDGVVVCGSQVDSFGDRFMNFLFYNEDLILTDSIVQLDPVIQIFDVAIAENKLFCSVRAENGVRLVYVLDIFTKNIVKTLPFEDNCWQFVEIDGQLVAMESTRFHYINTSTFEITTKTSKFSIGSEEMFYNQSDKLIYFLGTAAQPSLTQYYFLTYNLAVDESQFVTKDPIFITKPLVYDKKLNVIVSGGPRVYSLKGELLFEAESPAATPFIFIK